MRGVWNSGPVTDAPLAGPSAPALVPTTDPETGLTSAEVAERTTRGQVNATEQATSRPLWTIIRSNVFTRFNAILGVLFVLVLSTGSFADGVFGVILIVNSGIGIVQEYLAKRKLDQLALLNQPTDIFMTSAASRSTRLTSRGSRTRSPNRSTTTSGPGRR